MDLTFDVAVCGAGPGGAALASILASRGIKTALLERQSDFSREFRGEGVMPSGYEALKDIGFDLESINVPVQKNSAVNVYCYGEHLIDVEPPFEDAIVRWVSQSALLEHIISTNHGNNNFNFYRGHRVHDVICENGRVRGLRVTNTETQFGIKAKVVIGFDGRTSILRRKLNFDTTDFKQIIDVVWFKVPYPHQFLKPGRAFVNFVPGGFMVCPACYGDALQIGWIINKGSYREVKELGEEAWISEIQKVCPAKLSQHLEKCKGQITNKFVLDVSIERCLEWSKKGVLLLGDAAHTMSPVGAQGINIALRDAIVAANHLVPFFSRDFSDAKLDSIYKNIENERLPEVKKIQNFQKRPATVFKKQNPMIMLMIKNLPTLTKLSFVRKMILKQFKMMAYGVTNVGLKV
ncbi:MAG: FAD-dependent monooxygenase [Gammaproteobacteria bacterium]|nr:FAD-dependent monooxygenase [Gammaproteobacteria bacterium]